MYYDINRILVKESFQGQKWISGVECSLIEKKDFLIVFDINSKNWKYQDVSKWNSYLVSIGILKLQPSQKLDSSDNIVSKSQDELYTNGIISASEYKTYKSNLISLEFDENCKKVGVALEGTFDIVNSSEKITNPKFQYDKDSQFMLLQAKDILDIPYWRSVNNKNVVLSVSQKNTLYSLLLVTYFTKFAESRVRIDSL